MEIKLGKGFTIKKALIYAFVIGVLFDYFFIWHDLGVSVIIFNIIFMLSAIALLYYKVNLKRRSSYIFLIPYILLSLSYCIFSNSVFGFLNFFLLPLLGIGYLIFIRYDNCDIKPVLIKNILHKILTTPFISIFIFRKVIKDEVKFKKIKENTKSKYMLQGILFSIPILIVVICLLSSADMIFKEYFHCIGYILSKIKIKNIIGDVCVVLFMTLFVFTFFYIFKNEEMLKIFKKREFNFNCQPISMLIMIGIINVVYLIFSIIQYSYLYGGGDGILPGGISYSQYARKGFFQLIGVTLINLTILLFSKKYVLDIDKKTDKICKIFYSILIFFTYNMLFSAHYRMNLYESVFGYTRLRVFVEVFIFLLALIFIIILVNVWKKNIPVFKYSFILSLTLYVCLNFVNLDKIIAKRNIEIYNNTGKIDINYMRTLSYDAYDQINKLLDDRNIEVREGIKEVIEDKKDIIGYSYDKWYEFNYYKHKFYKKFN